MYMAYYTCKRILSRNCGLKAIIVMWMYMTVIRSISTYGALIWWPAIK